MNTVLALALATTLAIPATGAWAGSLKGAALMPRAKVALGAARATALKARAGAIVDQELEKEAGGSGLRYSFDVKSHGRVFEVGVDAVTGKVLENDIDTPD